jgi:guanyl-specific ribonuclease Sa
MKKVTSIFFSALIVAGALLCAGKDSSPARKTSLAQSDAVVVVRDGEYCSKDAVAEYIRRFGGALPRNYITKAQARAMGWRGGPLEPFAPGKSIGGDRFGNYEGLLPRAKGRQYYECDCWYVSGKRNAYRIIFSNDGLVFYTEDHYQTFVEMHPSVPAMEAAP